MSRKWWRDVWTWRLRLCRSDWHDAEIGLYWYWSPDTRFFGLSLALIGLELSGDARMERLASSGGKR